MAKAIISRFMREEKGQVLVFAAILIILLFGITAFTVDAGSLWWQKRELQNTADAASLAGARTLINGEEGQEILDEVEKYVEAHGFNKTDIINDDEIKAISQGDTEVPVVLKTNRDLFFARALGFQNADVASLAVAEVVSNPSFLIPNHALISFEEDGGVDRIRISGSIYFDSDGGQISAFSNSGIRVDGGAANASEEVNPIGYHVSNTHGNHIEDFFTGGLNPGVTPDPLPSPFKDILDNYKEIMQSSGKDNSVALQEAFEDAGFRFASYDYYSTENNRLYNENGDEIAFMNNQEVELEYSGLPRLVYIDGSMRPNRNVTIETGTGEDGGVGLVIIDGDLEEGEFIFIGNRTFNLQGIFYSTGDIDIGGNATMNIDGALWSEQQVWFHGNPSSLFQNTLSESVAPEDVFYSIRLKQ